jgi:hypothetical protein
MVDGSKNRHVKLSISVPIEVLQLAKETSALETRSLSNTFTAAMKKYTNKNEQTVPMDVLTKNSPEVENDLHNTGTGDVE